VLVYGDQREIVSPADQLNVIAEQLSLAQTRPPGLDAHVAIVSALIETGRLLQGIADADFDRVGRDRCSGDETALSGFLLRLAEAVVDSWHRGFNHQVPLPTLPVLGGMPDRVELRQPEGYAFYALYPEAYAEAARRLVLIAPPMVIGIRSIGTSLGAVVAAALRAPAPVTVRPFGDPFARKISLSDELEAELLSPQFHFVIVDEGPGQSGSSFGAVADWLQAQGVPIKRIAFLPSHANEVGPQASRAHRRRWWAAQKVPADLRDVLPRLLARWLEPVIGPLQGELVDISNGEWRRHFFAEEQDGPAVHQGWERRKFLASAGGHRFLVKFAGLGRIGERKLAMARALHATGLTPEPIGLAHGFLIERWCEQAQPLSPSDKPLGEVARYLGARARLFPAGEESGASLQLLHQMTVRNVSLALGDEAADAVRGKADSLDVLAARVVRVRTDNKLDPHEWLRTASGLLLKTDALDHHCGHDLIGCQDVAWDVAGAICEFGLEGKPADELITLTEHAAGRVVHRELLAFYRLAYAAFRLGLGTMAGSDDSGRQMPARQRYHAELQHLLARTAGATRQESLVE
jgi:hypothetical protein